MASAIPPNRAAFDREQVLAATRGGLTGPSWDRVVGVVTDSRTVEPGNLFVALRGERFDAHDFIQQAAASGATAALVHRGTHVPDGISAVYVDDTLVALGELARAHRQRWKGSVVGITGSSGKTTTKELTASAFAAAGRRVLKTEGNLNNRIGVPLTLLRLEEAHDTAVIEMGMSEPGEIGRLSDIAAPEVGVVVRVGLAHVERLGSLEAIADEKAALLRALEPEGVAVAHGDDPLLKKRASIVSAKRKILFGRGSGNDVRLIDWTVDERGTELSLQLQGKPLTTSLALLGEGAAHNAMATLATVLAMGLSVEDAARGMIGVRSAAGRLHLRVGKNGLFIVDDSYNANPMSLAVALRTAGALARRRRAPLYVVLGDMKELGAYSEREHQKAGVEVADSGAVLFVGVGEEMKEAVASAGAAGTDTLWFADSETAAAQVVDRFPVPGVVLVKGSRSMKMERVIEPLLEESGP